MPENDKRGNQIRSVEEDFIHSVDSKSLYATGIIS